MAQDKQQDPVVVSENGLGPYQQTVRIGKHTLVADEPIDMGGNAAGPEPFDFLLASLGACTSITLRMYAERKQLPLTGIRVELLHEKVASETHGKVDRILRTITLEGALTPAQRAGLLAIANKCPIYRTLQSDLLIKSSLIDGNSSEAVE